LIARANISIVQAGAFCTKRSQLPPFSKAKRTKSTASSSDIKYLVILGSVIVISLLLLICSIKRGITEPLDAITFPYLVTQIMVLVFDNDLALAIATFSISALDIPIALIGYAALSVLKQITFETLLLTADRITFYVPITLVYVASKGKNSQEGTCFNAAAWKT
jgi:hypothetical protein